VSFIPFHHLFLQLWWARERREGGGVVLSKCYGGGLWRVVVSKYPSMKLTPTEPSEE